MRALAFALLLALPLGAQETRQGRATTAGDIPSNAEINELLDKATEYVDAYHQAFVSAKPVLDKSTTPGFYEKGIELSSQASSFISIIRKKGESAYRLVALIVVLDDMSFHSAKAYAAAILVGATNTDPQGHEVAFDVLSLAQAGKNCDDISELILHPTLRLISFEENTLTSVADQIK